MPCRPDEKMCFKCGEWFNIKPKPYTIISAYHGEEKPVTLCDKCNQYKCPHCSGCLCWTSRKIKKAVHAMEQTYEKWIAGKGL